MHCNSSRIPIICHTNLAPEEQRKPNDLWPSKQSTISELPVDPKIKLKSLLAVIWGEKIYSLNLHTHKSSLEETTAKMNKLNQPSDFNSESINKITCDKVLPVPFLLTAVFLGDFVFVGTFVKKLLGVTSIIICYMN